jgi:hypothetical protein
MEFFPATPRPEQDDTESSVADIGKGTEATPLLANCANNTKAKWNPGPSFIWIEIGKRGASQIIEC